MINSLDDRSTLVGLEDHQMIQLLTYEAAARHCGVSLPFFKYRVKKGIGPDYVRPSPRTILFEASALDRWMVGWQCAGADRGTATTDHS
jgi:hypothetical protein